MYFAFQLAEHLHMTLDDLAERMTEDEFIGWAAYLKVKKRRER